MEIPYTRFQIENYAEKMKYCLGIINKHDMFNQKNVLYLTNGDMIIYHITPSSIAHILGLNTNYLASSKITGLKNPTSYDLLNYFIDNTYKIYTDIRQGFISFDQLFSSYIEQKLDSFIYNIYPNIFELEFVCKYNKKRTYGLEKIEEYYDYIICSKTKEGKILLLGLKKNCNEYIPMTNQVFENLADAYDQIKKYIENQNITFISSSNLYGKYDNVIKKFFLDSNAKALKTKSLKYYKEEFDATIDVSDDYAYNIARSGNEYSVTNSILDILTIIKDCYDSKRLITPNELGISSFKSLDIRVQNIINDINDVIATNDKKINYSEMLDKLEHLKFEIAKLTDTLKTKEYENISLRNQIISLTEENGQLKTNEEKILKIIKRED